MANKFHVSGKARVGYPVGITEYLAKRPDPIAFKHLNIHTFADIIFDLFFSKFKMIVSIVFSYALA